jgi:hypothetical protein
MLFTISDMNIKSSRAGWEEEIARIQKKLRTLGPMHPGSISLQYQVCGKQGCKCMHPTEPQRHGPYCKLSYVHRGKKVCRFVRADSVKQIKARLQAYKTFRSLTDRWIELSIKAAQAEFFPRTPENSPQR